MTFVWTNVQPEDAAVDKNFNARRGTLYKYSRQLLFFACRNKRVFRDGQGVRERLKMGLQESTVPQCRCLKMVLNIITEGERKRPPSVLGRRQKKSDGTAGQAERGRVSYAIERLADRQHSYRGGSGLRWMPLRSIDVFKPCVHAALRPFPGRHVRISRKCCGERARQRPLQARTKFVAQCGTAGAKRCVQQANVRRASSPS